MRGKFAVFCSAPAFGVWSCGFGLPLTPAHNALRCVLRSLVRTTATVVQNRKLVELRLWVIVPIRTGLGTGAVLVGSVVSLVNFRNYLGVVIGT